MSRGCFHRFIRLQGFSGVLALALLAFAAVGSRGDVPRPEHPRPDAYRPNWLTLNGRWQFEIDKDNDGLSRGLTSGKDLAATILVPFCPESRLSGIGNTDFMKHVWYRRSFELPEAMHEKRILLHFGAVDYQVWVYLNGQLVGQHIGGCVPFVFEITRFLRPGSNELVVRVFDDAASGRQPTGKQTHTVSEGCVYTRTTGIWQPVWLEAVGQSYVKDFSIVPDVEHGRVLINATVDGRQSGLRLLAQAFAEGRLVGSDSTAATGWHNHSLVVNLRERRLWEPKNPFLYDLTLTLARGKEQVDQVQSYFGLRQVTIDGRCILINGKRVFQRLILDQGFYPEGIWTAPTDAALKHDIQMSMAAGFNGARLHQKVFEPRFLYWADKLGYLVWGEFSDWGFNYQPKDYAPWIHQWRDVLLRDRNHPALIGWCPFNETDKKAGELQQIILGMTRAIDPTRPSLETSGYTHTVSLPVVADEVRDMHDYEQDPKVLHSRWEGFFAHPEQAITDHKIRDSGLPFMVSEFGGIGWEIGKGWGYGKAPETLDKFYARYQGLVDALLDNPNLFGFCYTQLTDVEQEHNGLYFYDRRPKFDVERLHAITARPAAYETTGPTAPPRAPNPGSHAAP